MSQILVQDEAILAVANGAGEFDLIAPGAVTYTVTLPNDFVPAKYLYVSGSFQANPDYIAPAAPRRLIRKSVVQDRLITIGKLAAILTVLKATGNEAYFAKWFAPDWPQVYADDPDMLTLMAAVGLTADQVAAATAVDPGAI